MYKLHKIGEYGHGKTVLAIAASGSFRNNLPLGFTNELGKEPKVFLYSLDLLDHENEYLKNVLPHAIIHTLNKFNYVKIIVLDFLTFYIALPYLHAAELSHSELEKIVIFNPCDLNSLKKKYINIFGEEVKIPSEILNNLKINPQYPLLKSKQIDMIGLQDPKFALRFASFYESSRIKNSKDYLEAIRTVAQRLRDE